MAKGRTVDDLFDKVKEYEDVNCAEIDLAQDLSRILRDISEERVRQGLSQQQLADICGLKQSAIARMESLQAIPRLDTVLRVATALKLKIEVVSSQVTVPVFKVDYSSKRINTTDYSYRTHYNAIVYSLPYGKVAV